MRQIVFTKLFVFDKLFFKNDEYKGYISLKDVLKSYLNLNSLRINVIVSAASINISRFLEKKEVFWKNELNQLEISELPNLKRSIRGVIAD